MIVAELDIGPLPSDKLLQTCNHYDSAIYSAVLTPFSASVTQMASLRMNVSSPAVAARSGSVSLRSLRAPRALMATRAPRTSVVRASFDPENWDFVPVSQMKDLINDRGFTIIDIRSPDEVAETGSKHNWKQIPLAAMGPDGSPVTNPNFMADVKAAFPNAMSRIVIACDDGTDRSEFAACNLCEQFGYSSLRVMEGGVDAYLDAFPGELQTVNKWQMSDQDMAGPDLSDLVNGVDTRQAGQRYY